MRNGEYVAGALGCRVVATGRKWPRLCGRGCPMVAVIICKIATFWCVPVRIQTRDP